jgi:hypothetical protein
MALPIFHRFAAAVLLLLTLGAGTLRASSGTESASFLDIPVGAGPAALGSAYSAQATDAYAPVYNPAGLGFLQDHEVAAQHLDYLESVHDEFLSGVYRLREGRGLGAAVQYLGSGNITGRDLSGNPTGDYNARYGAYSFAYGQTLRPSFAVGVTGKVIQGKISDVGSTAYAADVGSLWKARENLQLAAVVTNIGSKLTFLNDDSALPLAFHLGVAWRVQRFWTLSGEAVYPKTGVAGARFGIDWHPTPFISIRTGYRTDTTSNLGILAGFGTGLGLHVWGQEFSYAWTPYGDLGDAQYFSFVFHFGAQNGPAGNLQPPENNP